MYTSLHCYDQYIHISCKPSNLTLLKKILQIRFSLGIHGLYQANATEHIFACSYDDHKANI